MVDDHAILKEGLSALLNLCEDITVIGQASDGHEAIDLVRRLAPNVVVMDLAMPGMGGIEATAKITEGFPDARILILSQHDNERYILSALRAGAMGFILKRAASNELLEAIRTVARGESYLPPSIATVVLSDYRQQAGNEEDDYGLTDREKQVLKLVAEGCTSPEIAEMLHLSKKTVMAHRSNIYQKLGTNNRAELVRLAIRRHLIEA